MLKTIVISGPKVTRVCAPADLRFQVLVYNKYPMCRYSCDSCTSQVVFTVEISHSCFKIVGGTVVCHSPKMQVLCHTSHCLCRLFVLQQCCSLPYPSSSELRRVNWNGGCACMHWKVHLFTCSLALLAKPVGYFLKSLFENSCIPAVFHSRPSWSFLLFSRRCFLFVVDVFTRCPVIRILCTLQSTLMPVIICLLWHFKLVKCSFTLLSSWAWRFVRPIVPGNCGILHLEVSVLGNSIRMSSWPCVFLITQIFSTFFVSYRSFWSNCR